ncbi:RidA family protein [Variovorax paradoxus]|uniref:RidA family protein n=1 Tax=Variovorax paradoxus TaxID=34073 RepID=A0A5Q0M977_VARPD|nr:RidA family protein [Variovorax paradoxus]QFZ85184.1 RidA family protein [Variovorax paradoxus]
MNNELQSFLQPAGMAMPRGHYSHATSGGGLVFVSGQLPVSPDGSVLSEAPFEVQARQVLANVSAAVAGAGSAVDRLLHVRVYITDIDNWPTFNKLYEEWAGTARPARAVVPVPTLHYGCALEVEAVALT